MTEPLTTPPSIHTPHPASPETSIIEESEPLPKTQENPPSDTIESAQEEEKAGTFKEVEALFFGIVCGIGACFCALIGGVSKCLSFLLLPLRKLRDFFRREEEA